MVGEHPTIADLSMVGYVYYGDELTVPLGDFANVSRWMDQVRALPGWAHPYDLMPRAPGKSGR